MTWEQVTGLVGVVGGVVLGYLGYRRSRQVDATSAQSGLATETRAGTAQIIDALNSLLDQLQEDNKDHRTDAREFREAIRACSARLVEVEAERDAAIRERDDAKRDLAIFESRFGHPTPPIGGP